MALGLFSTLIIGTILKQIGDLMGGTYGTYLSAFAVVAFSVGFVGGRILYIFG